MDIITLTLAKNYTNQKIAEVASGFVYKGAVNYRADLDNIAADIGHIYTVKYKGTSGTTPWNAEFVYGNYEGTNTWIELGPDYEADIAALKTGKQDKLIAGENITIAEDGKTISATGATAPQYIELSWYEDGATGTLTDTQAQVLLASELNYIWLNGMHRLDFRYRDDNNNKATYSAVDTSSDGNKTHSIEINLTTKSFKVYHRLLQEKLTAGTNITISGNTISANVPTPESNYFLAIVNTTTFADIKAAYTAGKIIEAQTTDALFGKLLYKLYNVRLTDSNPTDFEFQTQIDETLMSVSIDSNGWHISSYQLEKQLKSGNAIFIDRDGDVTVNVKYDDNTIKVNSDGKLYATAGGQVIDCNSVGMIVPFAGAGTIPAGYLECNGAAVSRTTYSELFAVIGTTYGSGDGSTTFNLPNLQEKFIEGSSASKAVGTVINAGLPNIKGTVFQDTDAGEEDKKPTGAFGYVGGSKENFKNSDNYNSGYITFDAGQYNPIYSDSVTTVQPAAVVSKYIIKYTNTLGTLTTVIANPTLSGAEANLDSIQIGETKYNSSRIKPFPSEFVTKKTLQEFGQSIVNYSQFKMGSTWYGGIECSDLPGGMMQVECKVTAIRDTTITPYENIAIVEIFSSEVAPFYWTYNTNSWGKGTGLNDWKYVVEIDESKLNSITAAYNEELDVKVKKVNAAAGSTGWEFYVDKPTDISGKVDKPNEPVVGQGVNVPYYFDVNYSADKVTVKDYTIDLLNKNKAPQQFSLDINCASQTNAGLMSAADKKVVDEMLPAYPEDTEGEYILALKYVDGVWVKYWKEIANKSDIVDKGTVDYMVIKQ